MDLTQTKFPLIAELLGPALDGYTITDIPIESTLPLANLVQTDGNTVSLQRLFLLAKRYPGGLLLSGRLYDDLGGGLPAFRLEAVALGECATKEDELEFIMVFFPLAKLIEYCHGSGLYVASGFDA